MATQRKSTRNRPKAKKAARSTRGAPAKARPAKSAAARSRPASKPAAKSGLVRGKTAQPAKAVAKPGAKAGRTLKLKAAPRPPAVVRPLGVLPPESISRVAHKPARPLPLPKPVKPSAKVRKDTAADPGAQPVTAKDFQEFEQRLLEERGRVLKEMGHYETTVLKVNQRDSAGDLSGYSFHMADVGTDAMEREKAFQLASAEGRILLEINEALRRMARGEYGVCESCENPILRARLEAMPTARLCLSCKEKEERIARGPS
jgi:RNA polymerase-binding protein DksA